MNKLKDQVCPICGGFLLKPENEICCVREDDFLLLHCQRYILNMNHRQCYLEDMIMYLYDKLEELLYEQDDHIANYDEEKLIEQIEKRIFRWIRKGDLKKTCIIDVHYCIRCGTPIGAFRKKCTMCFEMEELKEAIQKKRKEKAFESSTMFVKKKPVYYHKTKGKFKTKK